MSSSATQAPPPFAGPRPAGGPHPQAPGASTAVAIDPVRLLKRHKVALIASVVAGLILGVLVYFPLLHFFPQYTAFVIFEAKSAIADASEVGNLTSATGGVDEMEIFMQTQVADMLSESLRTQLAAHPTVLNQTEFARKFTSSSGSYNQVDAVESIERRLRASVIPDTTYIRLQFRADNKTDAATIANTAANIYMARLMVRTNQIFTETEESISSRLRDAQAEVRQKEQQMQRLLGENQLESLEQRLTGANMMVASLTPQIAEAQSVLESLQDRLRELERMRSSAEGVVYPEEVRMQVQQHPIIASYDQQVAGLRAALRGLRERFGPTHMSVKAYEQQIKGTLDQRASEEQRLLEETFVGYIESMKTQIASTQAMLREAEAAKSTALLRMQDITRAQAEYQRLESEANLLQETIVDYRAQLQNAQALRARQSAAARILRVQDATAPDRPSFPNIFIIVPLVTILTVGVCGGVIFLREMLEQRVRMPADVQMVPRAKLLGVVPDVSEDPSKPTSVDTAVRDRPEGVIAEQIRQIRAAIAKARGAQQGGYAVLIVGGMPGAGATSVISAIAQSYAAMGDRVLVIDGNLRKPRMHQSLGLADAPGLSDCLAGTATLESAVQTMSGDTPVHLLSAGAKASRVYERLNSQKMADIVAQAKSMYDIVLIDAPPMVVASDGVVLATKCDASILVVKAYQETRGLIARVINQLHETRAQHLGIIVNGVKAAAGGYYRRNFRLAHRYNAGVAE